MPLYKEAPVPSARMGRLWTLAPVKGICVLEFGCMGHMIYAEKWRNTVGCSQGAELYTTHLSEKEIIRGSTARLEKAIAHLVEKDAPKALFLIPSSVGEVIGTDMAAVIEDIQPRFPGTRLYFSCMGGFRNTLFQGMTEAMLQLVQAFARSCDEKENSFNLLGCCPDWTNWRSDAAEIVRMMDSTFGLHPQCVLPGLCSAANIMNVGRAQINLVTRNEALPTAQWLNEQFGTPYIEGIPCGAQATKSWLLRLGEQLSIPVEGGWLANEVARAEQQAKACSLAWNTCPIVLGGHADQVIRLQRFLRDELGRTLQAVWTSDREVEGIPFCPDEAMSHVPMEGLLLAPYAVVRKAGLPEQFSLNWGPSIREEIGPMVGFKGVETLMILADMAMTGGRKMLLRLRMTAGECVLG